MWQLIEMCNVMGQLCAKWRVWLSTHLNHYLHRNYEFKKFIKLIAQFWHVTYYVLSSLKKSISNERLKSVSNQTTTTTTTTATTTKTQAVTTTTMITNCSTQAPIQARIYRV